MKKDKLVVDADDLEAVMDQIEALKAELKPLEEKEDAIRADLTKGLLSKGMQFIKTTSGMSFGLVKGRVMFKIKDGQEQVALEWALAEYPSIVSIAAAKLNKVVQPMLNPPSFVVRTEGEPHLSVRTQED